MIYMASGTELAKAYVQILPSAQGMKKALEDIMGKEMPDGEEPGEKVGAGLVSGTKKVLAAAGIGKVLKDTLMEGAALEQSVGGVETLFKDSAGKVIENAKSAYKTAGLSANQYMETVTSFSATLLQGLGGDTVRAAEIADLAITDMSDNANKFGSDMQSVMNAYMGISRQNYTMLDNLKLGYGGTASEMARLINDSGVLGEAIKVTDKTVKDVPFDQIILAINKIQDNLGVTGTTAKESASTFSGSFSSMKAAAQNLLGALASGEDVQEAADALLDTMETFLFENFLPMLERVFSSIVSGVGDAIKEGLGLSDAEFTTVAVGIEILTAAIVAYNIAQHASAIATAVSRAAVGAFGAVVGFITSPVTLAVLAIGSLIAIGVALYQNWEDVKEVASDVWDSIQETMDGFYENWESGWNSIKELWNEVVGLWQSGGETIKGWWDSLGQKWTSFKDNWASGAESIKEGVESVKDWFGGLWTSITDKVEAAYNWGKDLVLGFGRGIRDAFSSVEGALEDFGGMIYDWIHFSEPDKGPLAGTFHTFAPDMMKTFAEGIADNKSLVEDEINSMMGGVKASMMDPIEVRGSLYDSLASAPGGVITLRVADGAGRVIAEGTVNDINQLQGQTTQLEERKLA